MTQKYPGSEGQERPGIRKRCSKLRKEVSTQFFTVRSRGHTRIGLEVFAELGGIGK